MPGNFGLRILAWHGNNTYNNPKEKQLSTQRREEGPSEENEKMGVSQRVRSREELPNREGHYRE